MVVFTSIKLPDMHFVQVFGLLAEHILQKLTGQATQILIPDKEET